MDLGLRQRHFRFAGKARLDRDVVRTETLIYRSVSGTVRKIAAEHRDGEVSVGLRALPK
ncbi:MAG: hypothetical protein WCF20_13410 [Methylovirgula sp.]